MRKFRIICLKRSIISATDEFDYLSNWYNHCKLVYWKADCKGYTDNIDRAGLYTAEELNFIGGSWLDWIIEPAWK